MRLHHLAVTAFGPFVDTAEADFDTLSDAGLFLLSGPTGAGKSSVLDAVCFALYGAVPGDRQHAGHLRCDQAPAGLAPSVTLETTLTGRRFRIVRSPAWDRPKKRGTGTTREQARVSLSELVDGAWVPLSSRLDEAGDLLSGLLGMNLDQFCQVALLPQGRFQAFLRADSPSRHQLLSRLFRTGRFERVEAWLRDHRLALRRAADEQATAVAELVSRLSEAAATPVPEELSDLVATADAELPTWADTVLTTALERRETTAAESAEAAVRHTELATTLTATRQLAAARDRVVAAAESAERLEAQAPEHADRERRLDRARRAESVLPLMRLARERARALQLAQAGAQTSRADAIAAGLDVEDAGAELERVIDELATLTALLPAERRRDELHQERAAHDGELTRLAAEDELAKAEAAALDERVDELSALVEAGETRRLGIPAAEAAVATLQATMSAHSDLVHLDAELTVVRTEHEAARSHVLDLRQRLLDLRERRIAGMAAELAGGLVVGGDCPVCGSADHPHPAVSSDAPVDGRAERRAQHEVDTAQVVELALHEKVRDLATQRDRTAQLVGDSDPADCRAALAVAEAELAELRRSVDALDAERERLGLMRERRAALDEQSVLRTLRLTAVTTTLERLEHQLAELDEVLAQARGDHPELGTAVEHLTARRELARALRTTEAAAEAARTADAECRAALEQAAAEAGFEDVDDAVSARLPDPDRARLEQEIQDHLTALAAARRVLDEPEAFLLLTTPEPDVASLESAAQVAAESAERTRAAAEAATRTAARVTGLVGELSAALAAWAPLREELTLASEVASFAEGKAPDNRLQMRLSAYVLAHRLSQVVAAANARLATMSDRRYSVEHVGRRGAGERRGGLSLVVRDDWSGEARDPATLSGGETFVVSLALALGLADVVSNEVGGAELATLFVDEGFGALDSETLDDVLDILDGLRESGRAVGVVSHVAEMRDRIPIQLVVGKARTGSSLCVVG